jgi:hypothetical protein
VATLTRIRFWLVLLIDISIGVFGVIPLLIAYSYIRRLAPSTVAV